MSDNVSGSLPITEGEVLYDTTWDRPSRLPACSCPRRMHLSGAVDVKGRSVGVGILLGQ